MMPETPHIRCPDCGGTMYLRNSKYGRFYGCENWPQCDGKHGAHQGTGAPLGIPASKETRQARIRAHDAFDAYWRSHGWSRTRGYEWLQKAMNLSPAKCHIGRFNLEECAQVVKACEEKPCEKQPTLFS